MTKLKKLLTKSAAHEISWIGSRNTSSLLLKLFSIKKHLCIKLKDLWIALHNSFNSAQTREINIHVLDKIPNKPIRSWNPFSKQELINAIEKCNNSSTPGLHKLTWNHIKSIIRNKDCIFKLIDIANTCIDLGHWLSHFKTSTTIVIPKSNKSVYNFLKLYWTIVLLNKIGKLFEKIGECLQFYTISNSFIHYS